jgi:hypothetical protein
VQDWCAPLLLPTSSRQHAHLTYLPQRPIATFPAPSSNTGSSEISVATPVHAAADNAAAEPTVNGSSDSLVMTNGFFKPKEGVKGKGSYMQQVWQQSLYRPPCPAAAHHPPDQAGRHFQLAAL